MSKQTVIVMIAVVIIAACKKEKTPVTAPVVTTAALTNITTSGATAGGTIVSNGDASIMASGVVWSKKNNTPTLADSVVNSTVSTGDFTVNLANLEFGKSYYVRAYATNSAGTGYGDVVMLTTVNDTTKVRFSYNGRVVTYGIIISPKTGRKWMDRNLGASRVAVAIDDTAAYGHYFQWGRPADGHQIRTSNTTTTLATSDTTGNGNFITVTDPPLDWRSDNNDNRWQTNPQGPCPTGWHVPTQSDWNAESGTGGITDNTTAMTYLKLPGGGSRQYADGTFSATVGNTGSYWSSTVDPGNRIYAFYLNFTSSNAGATSSGARATGYCLRCIKN